ncbi:Zn-dependent hydrolase [Clostridium polyendosporum]|uniref:Zn-dependent hydrolase n=1 Tax=Clostridium polyendosporum TaxID=69208 RepID=A0A919VN96_9CLOT|nr:M20 family metallo-hydrolase [Clostridium polyendosporum]GIM30348.1 Zn-dependent hydrolase [Clostridium polyendosporum]
MMNEIKLNIEKHLKTLSGFTSTINNGVTRFPFTKEAKEATEYLKSEMEKIGLKTRVDESGAVIGRLEGKEKRSIIIGSHYDSVKNGGEFDGIAGVVCGMEVARLLKEKDFIPKYSLEVIGTNDEEGARFKSGFFSSKAMLGQLSVSDLKNLKDADNVSIYDAMKEYGLDPESINNAARNLDDIKGFIEIHVEQGPVLEKHQKDIGIVDTIVGMQRYMVNIDGRADHAGTTPMDMRIDAVEVASKIISNIGDFARLYKDAVATVGSIKVLPNEINTIAENVAFSIDIRSTDQESIDSIYKKIVNLIEQTTSKYDSKFSITNTLSVKPINMNEKLKERIEDSCKKRKFSYEHINSGAGHDSLPMAESVDTAMIFVPSKEGRSHCKEEFTNYEHLAKATLVALDVITEI